MTGLPPSTVYQYDNIQKKIARVLLLRVHSGSSRLIPTTFKRKQQVHVTIVGDGTYRFSFPLQHSKENSKKPKIVRLNSQTTPKHNIQKKIASSHTCWGGGHVACDPGSQHSKENSKSKLVECNRMFVNAPRQHSKENSKIYALTSISSMWEIRLTTFKRNSKLVEYQFGIPPP